MARTQVTGEEIRDDSLKGVDVDERTLDSFNIPYSLPDVTADNLHDAITEVFAGRFFKNKLDRDIVIPTGRSLVVMDYIDLDGFELCIDGGLEISL